MANGFFFNLQSGKLDMYREYCKQHGISMTEPLRQCIDDLLASGVSQATPCGIHLSGGVVQSGLLRIYNTNESDKQDGTQKRGKGK